MKKIFLFLVFITLTINLQAQYDKEIEDLINSRVLIEQNKINKIEITEIIIENTPKNPTTRLTVKKIYIFDKKGNKISLLNYCQNDVCDSLTLKEKINFKYNENNDLIEVLSFDPKDSITFHREWQYRYKKGKIVEEKSRHSDVPEWFYTIYGYDKTGRMVKEKTRHDIAIYHYTKDKLTSISFISDKMKETHIYLYDTIGNKIETDFKYQGQLSCGNVPSKEQYEYYPDKRLKSKLIFDSGVTWRDDYKYFNDTLTEIKRYRKHRLIGDFDFEFINVTYLQYNQSGLIESKRVVQEMSNRITETKVSYLKK
jgi:hypothetical protein